jgi:hypothetical protein
MSFIISHTYVASVLCEFSKSSAVCTCSWNSTHNLCKHIWMLQFRRGTQCVPSVFCCMWISPTASTLHIPILHPENRHHTHAY